MSPPVLELSSEHLHAAAKEHVVDHETKPNEHATVDYLSLPDPTPDKPTKHHDLGSAKLANGLLDPDAFRSLTASPFSDYSGRTRSPVSVRALSPLPIPTTPRTWPSRALAAFRPFWARNRSVLLVATAQLFGALMNMMARLLELDGDAGLNPFQILFARMSLTTLFSCVYAVRTGVPDFPLGPARPRAVRLLLAARGFSGFFGIFGMWYSMMYLPLAEATVITFLAPSVAGYVCHVLLRDPYTRREQLASLVALAGVVFIARPASLFPSHHTDASAGVGGVAMAAVANNSTVPHPHHHHPPTAESATPAQRLAAIGVALVGVLGGAGAFTTIRAIGARAHPLVSVNYFSVWAMAVSAAVLAAAPALGVGQPALRFVLPASARQWALLAALGAAGFVMQVMMTSGIAAERSNRATAMVYTHMLFAAGFDRWVFGHEMGLLSLVGCGLIVGSALWAVLTRKEGEGRRGDVEVGQMEAVVEEGVPMLRGGGAEEEEEEDDGHGEVIPLGRVG